MSKHADELTRKDMKAPDAFQTTVARAAAWATGKQKVIVGAVVGVIVLLGVGLGMSSWLDSRKDAAGGMLYKALDSADGQISSVPLPGVTAPLFPNAEAQWRAVLAQADEVRKAYPGSEAARTATLAAAAANLRLRLWDAAVADDEAYLAGAQPKDSLAFLALDGIAEAKEAKGDTAGAIAAYERMQQQAPVLADRATLERARLLARSGKPEEARKLLQGFPQEFKESQLRPEAERQLAALGGAN